MTNTESMEMYLETIYILEEDHGHAHSVEIAKRLGVSKPSVTKAMKALVDKGLILKESYGTITLTEEGKKISERVYSSHKYITKYLEHSLGLSPEIAVRNACKIEHVVSEEMYEAIKKYLDKNKIETESNNMEENHG